MTIHHLPLPAPVHDVETLFSTRWELRRAYAAIRRMPQRDPTVRDVLNQIDDICAAITTEIDTIEPEFQFRLQELAR